MKKKINKINKIDLQEAVDEIKERNPNYKLPILLNIDMGYSNS